MIYLKSNDELQRMREAGRHVAEILLTLREHSKPGITTGELNEIAEREIRARSLESSFLNYAPGDVPPYPAVVCTSINEEIVHGIPGERVVEEGDLLKVDFGAIHEGFHGDSAVAVPIGDPRQLPSRVRELVDVTLRSLYAGIEQLTPGNRLGDVSHAVQATVEAAGFSVVKQFVGHGIGRRMHEDPQVPNFGRSGKGPRLKAGMVVAIEPMVNMGSDGVEMRADRWTAATADGELSCHFEHTVAITENGPEILTRIPGSH
jgi:methionyl aminopeptidase